jgi:chemotaxis protein MotB
MSPWHGRVVLDTAPTRSWPEIPVGKRACDTPRLARLLLRLRQEEASIMQKGLLAVALAIGVLSGCVSQSKYRALETRATAERAALEQELSTLRSERADLEAQKTSLERDLTALRDEVARRGAELSAIAALKSELESERDTLQRQIAALGDRLTDTEKRAVEVAKEKDEEIKRLRGTYDNLIQDLKGEIEKGEIKVKQVRDKLTVQLVEKVLFDSGKAEVKPEGRDVLAKVGKILRDISDKQIRIEGYTDSVPIGAALRRQFPSNWELATQRATTVLRFLQDKAGVDGKHLSAVGYGPYRPVASNDTETGRAENRRIEIVLLPVDITDLAKDLR